MKGRLKTAAALEQASADAAIPIRYRQPAERC
jgi:hypothetical protein